MLPYRVWPYCVLHVGSVMLALTVAANQPWPSCCEDKFLVEADLQGTIIRLADAVQVVCQQRAGCLIVDWLESDITQTIPTQS